MNCFLKFLKESVVTTCEQSRIKFYRNHGKPRKTKGNSVAFTNLLLSYFILFLSSITQTYLIEDPGIQGSTLRITPHKIVKSILSRSFAPCSLLITPCLLLQIPLKSLILIPQLCQFAQGGAPPQLCLLVYIFYIYLLYLYIYLSIYIYI